MNNFNAKNIILNLDGTTDLPYKTTNDVIIKDNQSVNYGFNNSVQQLADNDMYIRHILREQQQYQAGPNRLTDESLSKTIDNYKYLNIDNNEISILQKHNYPLSATMERITNVSAVKKIFNDGKYYMLADTGLYAAAELSDLGSQKIVDIDGSQICAVVYDVDNHTLMYSGSGNIKGKIGIITGFANEEIARKTLTAKYRNTAINETIISMEYDNEDDTLYIGTKATENSGKLYISKGRQLDESGTAMQFQLVQPINKPVLTICKLSSDSYNNKILAGTFGDGMYESSVEYQFVDLVDDSIFPTGYAATCICMFEDKKIVGTNKGVVVISGSQQTVKLNNKSIRNAKTVNGICYVAAADGLYIMKSGQTDFTKIENGSIVDVCVLENGTIAIAKDNGLFIARSVDQATFSSVSNLANIQILAIAKLGNTFYASSANSIYKVIVEIVNTQRTDKSLESFVNDAGKTFQQACGTNARISKAQTIGNSVYLLTTVGLLDIEFNVKYGISKSVNNIRKCNDYLLVSTTNGLAIVKNNQTYWQFTSSEIYDAFYDGKMLYVAAKNGNSTIISAIDESNIAMPIASPTAIKKYDGQNISIAGKCYSMAVVSNTIYIIVSGSLKYLDIKIQTNKVEKSKLFNIGSKTISEFKFATNNNFSYASNVDENSQYVSLNTNSATNEVYQLCSNGEFKLVAQPNAVLPKMAIGQSSNLTAFNVINTGIIEKNTLFTSSLNKKVLYNFEQSETTFSEADFADANSLSQNASISKITYPSDINCIVDLTIDNNIEKYAAKNEGGEMFLVGTKSNGIYLHHQVINSKPLSTLNNYVTLANPLGNISCLAAAEYTSTTLRETDPTTGNESIQKAKELMYFAAVNNNLYFACTIDNNEHSKNEKYKYANFKQIATTISFGKIEKLMFQYNGNTPVGCLIAAANGLFYASIEYNSFVASGTTYQIPTPSVAKLATGSITLSNVTDVAIAHGLLFIIANGIMYYGTLVASSAGVFSIEQAFNNIPTLNSMQLVEVPDRSGDTKIVGLCITKDSKKLVSLDIQFTATGISKTAKEVSAATTKIGSLNTSAGTFAQLVLLQNFAGQVVLAAKFTLDSKNYLAYITKPNDEWHLVRINYVNDSESTYSVVTLDMFNLHDASTGNIVGCVVQHATELYNITNQIDIDMSEYRDTTENKLDFSDIARETLASGLAATAKINTQWFAACGEDTTSIVESNEIIDSYMLVGVFNGKATMYRSSIVTELSNPAAYNIFPNLAIQEINVTDVVSPKKDHANLIAICVGKTVILAQQYSTVIQELFRIEETNNVVHACVDSENQVLIYSTRNGNTDNLKYVNIIVEDVNSIMSDGSEGTYIFVRKDGEQSEIDITSAGKVLGMFSSYGKAFIVCNNGVYQLESNIVAMNSPTIVNNYIDTYGPLSLTESNTELVLLTQTRGELKKYNGMQFSPINDRIDTFNVQYGGITYAVADGKIYTRTANSNGQYTQYSYEIVDDTFSAVAAIACFNKSKVCLVAQNDIKTIKSQTVAVSELKKMADLLVGNGATHLLEDGNSVIAFGRGILLIIDANSYMQGNIGFSPSMMAYVHNGYLAYDSATKQLKYTQNLLDGKAERLYILDGLPAETVDATNTHLLLKSKLMSYATFGRNIYFNHVDNTQSVVDDICKVNDNEALLMQYADKNYISLYWMKNRMLIKNQKLRNIGKAKIVDLHAVDSTSYNNLYAILCQSGEVYVSQNDKFTKWELLFNMHDSNIANGLAANAELFDIMKLTQFSYAIATSNGLFYTKYKYSLANNYSKTTQYDINMAILSCCQSLLNNHVNAMHSDSTAAGKFINTINNDLMPTDFSEIDPTWQKINNECTIIENDIVEHVEFGATDMHVSAMYANAQDLSNWTNSTDLTYIDKQYKSNIHELYIYLPTTGTNYIPLPIFSDSKNALSGKVKNNATHIRVLLDPAHYDIQEMMEVQINGNSFPLGMTQTEDLYGDEGKMFHSCILPSIAKFAPLQNNVSAESIPTLSGMYMIEFQCFGSDAQAIKLMFKQKNKYSVQFKANQNAYGYMDDQTFTVGESQKLSKNKYIVDGSLFKGWIYKADTGATKTFIDEEEIKSTFDNSNQSFTNNNGIKVQLSAEFSKYTFSSADTQIKLNSDLAYISSAKTYEYGANKTHGVVVDFGA